MDKFTVAKFTSLDTGAIIVRLRMFSGNRRPRLKMRVETRADFKGGLFVLGTNFITGVNMVGEFRTCGESWIGYV